MKGDFAYQSEKFSQARSSLMAPRRQEEADSFAAAFEFCQRALYQFDKERVEEEEPRRLLDVIESFLDTKGLQDPAGRGLYRVKAESLSADERAVFSKAVDELASYFNGYF